MKKSSRLFVWSIPRATIDFRGIYFISTAYTLEVLFFYANWWSLGLNYSSLKIILSSCFLAPVLGFIWLHALSALYYGVGKMFQGSGTFLQLKTALVYSKTPYLLSLCMWLGLIVLFPSCVFIQDSQGPSSIFINATTLSLGIWSLILLTQIVKRMCSFSFSKTAFYVLTSFFLSQIFFFISFCLFRYLCLIALRN